MSQTTSLPGGDSLPKLPKTPVAKDRTKKEATRSRDTKERNKEPNVFERIITFVRQVVAELKKVHYPSREELWMYFLVVIVFVAAMMTFTGVVDFAFGELSQLVFG